MDFEGRFKTTGMNQNYWNYFLGKGTSFYVANPYFWGCIGENAN